MILDDTQTLKRAKKMDAVGKLYHHASGQYGCGHTILKACLYYRGVKSVSLSNYKQHASPDHEFAQCLERVLRQQEHTPFRDETDIRPG